MNLLTSAERLLKKTTADAYVDGNALFAELQELEPRQDKVIAALYYAAYRHGMVDQAKLGEQARLKRRAHWESQQATAQKAIAEAMNDETLLDPDTYTIEGGNADGRTGIDHSGA